MFTVLFPSNGFCTVACLQSCCMTMGTLEMSWTGRVPRMKGRRAEIIAYSVMVGKPEGKGPQ
jgi:hypothetical protein